METLQRLHNQGSVSTGYDIENSLKFENANSEGLLRNADGNADDRTKFSFSGWYKRSQITRENWMFAAAYSSLKFMDDDTLRIELYTGSATSYWDTTRKFRDTSAWYHLVFAVDTTLGTAADRVKVWVNGVLQANTNTGTAVAQNATTQFGTDADNYQIGYYYAGGANWRGHCGYMADLHYVDGIVNDADSFGEFDEDSGIWKPKAYAGGYGTNGFNLKFAASGDLGADSSGNSNTYSLSNITAADQSTDTPTNNFCTYNNNFRTASTIAATEGQTKVTAASGAGWVSIVSTFGLTSGKWYWEAASSGHYVFYGIADVESDVIPQATGGYFLGYGDDNSTKAIGMYGINGTVYSDTAGHNGPGAAANTVVQIALDMDNRCVYFGANGSYISGADPTSGASKTNASQWNTNWTDTVYPALSVYAGYHSTTNFGGYTTDVISSPQSDANGYGTFEYAPPSGYYAICTKNLAEFG